MGWSGEGSNYRNIHGMYNKIKAYANDMVKETNDSEIYKWTILDFAIKNNTLYFVGENKVTKIKMAFVDLFRTSSHELFVKNLNEEMGPYESNCPKKILKQLTPTDNEIALEWRKRCWNNFK